MFLALPVHCTVRSLPDKYTRYRRCGIFQRLNTFLNVRCREKIMLFNFINLLSFIRTYYTLDILIFIIKKSLKHLEIVNKRHARNRLTMRRGIVKEQFDRFTLTSRRIVPFVIYTNGDGVPTENVITITGVSENTIPGDFIACFQSTRGSPHPPNTYCPPSGCLGRIHPPVGLGGLQITRKPHARLINYCKPLIRVLFAMILPRFFVGLAR